MSIAHSAAFEQATVFRKARTPVWEFAVMDPSGAVAFLLDPTTYSLSRDRTRAARGHVEFTCPGTPADLVPPGVDWQTLTPFGVEVRVSRGYEYMDGTVELLTRGLFRLKTVRTTRGLSGVSTQFTGDDRAERFDRENVFPFDAMAAERYDDIIVRLLQQTWRGASTSPLLNEPPFRIAAALNNWLPGSDASPMTAPPLHFEARSRGWSEASTLAAAVGRELFMDPNGTVALQPLPDRLGPPVWSFSDTQDDTRIELAQTYSSDDTPNYWTVNATGPSVGSGSDGISGVAKVDDASSSLDINGRFGTNPRWIDSQYATTPDMCRAQAEAAKSKVLAGTDTIEIQSSWIGFLLEGDIIDVISNRLGLDRQYVVTSVDEGFLDQPMRVVAGSG